MNISIRQELEQYVEDVIKAGQYANPSEVISSALEVFRNQDSLSSEELQELRAEIAIGIEQLDRGEGQPWDAEDLKMRFREQLARKQKAD